MAKSPFESRPSPDSEIDSLKREIAPLITESYETIYEIVGAILKDSSLLTPHVREQIEDLVTIQNLASITDQIARNVIPKYFSEEWPTMGLEEKQANMDYAIALLNLEAFKSIKIDNEEGSKDVEGLAIFLEEYNKRLLD